MGGWLQFGRGEVGWERRRRNRGRECQQVGGYIMVFSDGIIDRLFLSVTVPRHCTAISV
jgi:hypothetical protein